MLKSHEILNVQTKTEDMFCETKICVALYAFKGREKASGAPAYCKTKHVEDDIKAQNSLL